MDFLAERFKHAIRAIESHLLFMLESIYIANAKLLKHWNATESSPAYITAFVVGPTEHWSYFDDWNHMAAQHKACVTEVTEHVVSFIYWSRKPYECYFNKVQPMNSSFERTRARRWTSRRRWTPEIHQLWAIDCCFKSTCRRFMAWVDTTRAASFTVEDRNLYLLSSSYVLRACTCLLRYKTQFCIKQEPPQ